MTYNKSETAIEAERILMRPISDAARRPPTDEETAEATEILAFIDRKSLQVARVALLAYFLREAEETGKQKERQSLGPH